MTNPERFTMVVEEEEEFLTSFARDVRAGLTASPKSLPCRYFYDEEGSRLFEEICELPEYYLTRAEREILEGRATEIAGLFSKEISLVELGSGSAVKTRLLIEAFLKRHGSVRFVPVDISSSMLEESSRTLLEEYPNLEILALAGEYRAGLEFLGRDSDRPRLILWLGSNVGNYDRPGAEAFLGQVESHMAAGDLLLVGIDLRKDPAVLLRAYDDERGVTARFNLNLLSRINSSLGGHFDLESFRHRATYDEVEGRVSSYLVSTRRQQVAIDGLDLAVSFEVGETIHTEDSFKYSPREIDQLARAANLQLENQWFDRGRLFSVNVFAPGTNGGAGQA